MKKLFGIILSAALLTVACSEVHVSYVSEPGEVSFITASCLTRVGIDGPVFPTTETFGAYAWAEGTAGPYFMENTEITFNSASGLWKPLSTYYWPKNNTVDFICYYPYNMSGIAISEDKIEYTGIDVASGQEDIMYADKAVGYSGNVDEADDSLNGYTGVPTIFHHALAKVRVIISLAYNHKEEADGTVTDWAVSINSMSIDGFYKSGSCTLNLESSPATGIVGWEKPVVNGSNVWTPDAGTASKAGSFSGAITPGNEYETVGEFFVLPQALTAGQQKVSVSMTVDTRRNGNPFLSETFSTSADLYLASLPAWEINHVITYKLVVAPTGSDGNGGNGSDPNNPVDPTDPDLSDAVITFDPAVNGWDNINVVATINI
ncbi:MAG: fimbrillin family protein [Bacteroidales bacterium]|nr:fimbrillin family protein [Bacteroidales bacterium]